MSSAERTSVDDAQGPGATTPGTGAAPSTGKESKPVEAATPSPDDVAAIAGSQEDSGPVSAESDSDDAIAPCAAAPADGTGADATTVQDDLDELTRALKQRDEYLALAQRTQADFENFRKRTARDARAAEARGVVRLVKELLPALDNLGRALSAAAQDDPLLAGVRLVHDDLSAALRRQGVESYSPEGERFDPVEHEAMVQQPVEGVQSGTVVEVYQAGYRLDGTVIRPARVVVAA